VKQARPDRCMLFAFVMLIVCFTARADAEIYLGITPYSIPCSDLRTGAAGLGTERSGDVQDKRDGDTWENRGHVQRCETLFQEVA
jgi:hypothetical protein